MGDILPRRAGTFPFKCAEGHCYGQPEKMSKIEILLLRFRGAQNTAPATCHLQFQPKILTVRFAAKKLPEICKQAPKTLPEQSPTAVLSASLLDRFPDLATVMSFATS